MLAALAVALTFLVSGCDGAVGVGGEGVVTFEGRVTDDAGFGKAAAQVEGAVVTAANVTASGTLQPLEGQATTDAQGRFRLRAEAVADEVVLAAQKTGFTSKTMVHTSGRTSVNTMPMTVETHVEADVFVEARMRDDAGDVSMADVAVFVTKQVAADVRAGATTAADIAAAIVAEARAKKHVIRHEEEDADEARRQEDAAFVRLQADLSVATSAEAETAALEAIETALIRAHVDAGMSIATQARARQAGRAALVRFSGSVASGAGFELRKKAELLVAMATAEAVEASFQAEGASTARLSALAQARGLLIAALRAAATTNALASAWTDYESRVRSELASEAEVDSGTIEIAASAMLASRTALQLAVNTAPSAVAVATAYAEFFPSAETAALATLEGATARATLAASVLALLSAS